MSDQQEQPDPAQAGAARAGEPPRRALLLDSDLFFSVKVTDTLKHAGYQTRTVRQIAAFTQALEDERPVLVLVNTAARGIDWRAGIVAARTAGLPVVAFGSHVDLAAQEQARQAGATSVIANSKLASDLPGVVARALRRETATNTRDTEASDDAASAT